MGSDDGRGGCGFDCFHLLKRFFKFSLGSSELLKGIITSLIGSIGFSKISEFSGMAPCPEKVAVSHWGTNPALQVFAP